VIAGHSEGVQKEPITTSLGISVELGTNIQPEEKSNIDCILKTVRIDMESLGIEKNTEKGWKSDWERR
jgi:hypothetical protein